MGAKVTEKVYLPHVEKELRAIMRHKIIVGPAAEEGSELAVIAASNEFGAEIKPKSSKFLAIPLIPQAKGKRPSEFNNLFFIPGKHGGYGFLARKTSGENNEFVFLLKKLVRIPERAYMRKTFDSAKTHERALKVAREMLQRVIAGSATAEDFLNAVGSSYVASVKTTIAGGVDPANSELTLKMKSGSTTLIDEGRLLKSINYEVE